MTTLRRVLLASQNEAAAAEPPPAAALAPLRRTQSSESRKAKGSPRPGKTTPSGRGKALEKKRSAGAKSWESVTAKEKDGTTKDGGSKNGKKDAKEDEDKDGAVAYVACDRCGKWRELPSALESSLPAKWYCELNTWDKAFASCNVPQQDFSNDENDFASSASGETPKTKARAGNKPRKAKTQATAEINDMNQKQRQSMLPSKTEVQNWAQCVICSQWRRLPGYVDVHSLPENWQCLMNPDKSRASCSVPEESDETLAIDNTLGSTGNKHVVRLPEGVNLYGNMYVPARGRRHAPMNFRELVVTHYRHFNRFDSAANACYNARYCASSAFSPRGHIKGSGYRRSPYEKGLVGQMSNDISATTRKYRGISAEALVGETTLERIFQLKRRKLSGKKNADKDDEESADDEEIPMNKDPLQVAREFVTPPPNALLKLSKPWKKVLSAT